MGEARPEVVLFTMDAGGGHRAAASALGSAVERRQAAFALEVLSLQHVLSPLDPIRRVTGRSLEDTYNGMVRRRRTRLLVPLLRGLQWTVRALHAPLARLVAEELARRRPVAVVSVAPNFNSVILAGARASHPGVPVLVLLTDFADMPPHFWMEPGLDGVLVATEHAAAQARAVGLASQRIHRMSGMVLHPRFYPRPDGDRRRRARAELGVPPDAFAVLVLFGGKGSPEMRPLCERLLEVSREWHVIAVSGDNPPLFRSLRTLAATSHARLHAMGFTDRVPHWMAACDVLVTKPGPGSLAEAFHMRIPVVVCGDARTIPQERFNVCFVQREGLGLAVPHWRQMPAAVEALADPARRAGIRRRLEELPENRALHEALEVIGRAVAARTAVLTS